jgi:hypothetical protein
MSSEIIYIKNVVRITEVVHKPLDPVTFKIVDAVAIYLRSRNINCSAGDLGIVCLCEMHTRKLILFEGIDPILQNFQHSPVVAVEVCSAINGQGCERGGRDLAKNSSNHSKVIYPSLIWVEIKMQRFKTSEFAEVKQRPCIYHCR